MTMMLLIALMYTIVERKVEPRPVNLKMNTARPKAIGLPPAKSQFKPVLSIEGMTRPRARPLRMDMPSSGIGSSKLASMLQKTKLRIIGDKNVLDPTLQKLTSTMQKQRNSLFGKAKLSRVKIKPAHDSRGKPLKVDPLLEERKLPSTQKMLEDL